MIIIDGTPQLAVFSRILIFDFFGGGFLSLPLSSFKLRCTEKMIVRFLFFFSLQIFFATLGSKMNSDFMKKLELLSAGEGRSRF